LQTGDFKRRPISARACDEACRILQATRARRGSSPPAHFQVRRCAPNRFGRRATRFLPWSDALRLPAAFSRLARNSSHSWTCSSPFDCCSHFTITGTPSPRNSLKMPSKDSILQIEETRILEKKNRLGNAKCRKSRCSDSVTLGLSQDHA